MHNDNNNSRTNKFQSHPFSFQEQVVRPQFQKPNLLAISELPLFTPDRNAWRTPKNVCVGGYSWPPCLVFTLGCDFSGDLRRKIEWNP